MKKFTLELKEENGTMSLTTSNDGFSALEICGLFAWKQNDIIAQIEGRIQPDIVKRNLIQD